MTKETDAGGPVNDALPAERAVLAVLTLHDRDHWCYDVNGGSAWYSNTDRPPRRPRWPCPTLSAVRDAGFVKGVNEWEPRQ